MRTSLDCLSCIVRQAVESSRLVTVDEERIMIIMRLLFDKLSKLDLSVTPPEVGQIIHSIIRNELNCSDPFIELKKLSLQRALSLAKEANIAIRNSEHKFSTAIAFAIAGNILDFGMKSEWNESIINRSFSLAIDYSKEFDSETISELYREIENANTVLVLGDNVGESVFDKIMIEHFPGNAKIFYAVKGSPIINDVTEQEAIDSQINEVAEIISNGADIPGTVLKKSSLEFVELYNSADVIISKGQGNYETLNEEKKKIWFLFQVKCPVIARHYNYKLGDWKVINTEVESAN